MTLRSSLVSESLTGAVQAQAFAVGGVLARTAIVPTHLTTGENTTDQASYATASISPAGNTLVLLWVAQTATTANGPTSVTGNGLTYTEVARAQAAATTIVLYRAMAAAPSSGAVTINFNAGDTTTGAAWSAVQYAGVNTTGTHGSGAIVQNVASSAGASVGQTITLAAAFEDVNNLHAYGIVHLANEVTTPGTGFTERGDAAHATPALAIETADKPNDTTADVTWTTSSASRWVAVEVKAG